MSIKMHCFGGLPFGGRRRCAAGNGGGWRRAEGLYATQVHPGHGRPVDPLELHACTNPEWPLAAKSGFGMIRSDMRKGFGHSSFESTVGVADGLMGDNLEFTPPHR